MGFSPASYYKQRSYLPPFAANDPSLLVNLYPVVTQAGLTAASFTFRGSPAFDPALGMSVAGTTNVGASTFSDTYTLSGQFTAYMEVERSQISVDNSVNSGTVFYDSSGFSLANNGNIFTVYKGSNNDYIRLNLSGGGIIPVVTRATVNVTEFTISSNSHQPAGGNYDPRFAQVIFSISGTNWYLWIDGLLIQAGTIASVYPTTTYTVDLGLYSPGGGFGFPGWIRAFQLSNRAITPQMAGPLIGFYGDSFTIGRGWNANKITGSETTIPQVNATQVWTTPANWAVQANQVTDWSFGQTGWGMLMEQMALRSMGAYFPAYVSGHAGQGWLTGNQIPVVYRDALNAARVEHLFCMLSVNDIASLPIPSNYVPNITAILNYFVDNNPSLRTINLIEKFPWNGSVASGTGMNTLAYSQAWSAERTMLRSTFPGLLVGTGARATSWPRLNVPSQLPVNYIPVSEQWDQAPGFSRYINCTHPQNVSTTASPQSNGVGTGTVGGEDHHPSSEGMVQMANLVWPYVQNLLNSGPY